MIVVYIVFRIVFSIQDIWFNGISNTRPDKAIQIALIVLGNFIDHGDGTVIINRTRIILTFNSDCSTQTGYTFCFGRRGPGIIIIDFYVNCIGFLCFEYIIVCCLIGLTYWANANRVKNIFPNSIRRAAVF